MAKTELSVVVRINAAYENDLDDHNKVHNLIAKIRKQVDNLYKEPGVTAVNMDYTTSKSDA